MSATPGLRVLELSIEGLAALGAGNACDLEPIHLSGAIQPYGFLLAVDPVRGDVVAASANAAELLGLGADGVLGRPLSEVLGREVAEALLTMAPTANPHEALSTRFSVPAGPAYDIAWHTRDGVLLLEFEPGGDSQTNAYYLQQRNATRVLSSIDDVETLCDLAARQVRSLTGYDRVMIYRFVRTRTDTSSPRLAVRIPRRSSACTIRPVTSRVRPGRCTCATGSGSSATWSTNRCRSRLWLSDCAAINWI